MSRRVLVWSCLLALVSAGCAGSAEIGDTTSSQVTTTTEAPEATTTSEESSESTTTSEPDESVVDGEPLPQPIDSAVFTNPTLIDHKYLPLAPGTRLVLDGVTLEEDEQIPHQIIYTVSDLTKTIAGIETVVSWILDYSDGELVEAEIAFFAQDDDGNVWQLGEYPEEYEDGEFLLAPSWIHGIEGSLAGIRMPADPQPGTDSYAQGWGPAVGWDDRGKVFEVGTETCVETGCYDDVLIVDEFSLEEPTFFQVKYYAAGVGNVQVGWKGNDPEGELLELVELLTLDEAEMAEVRAEVLALDTIAYERNEAYAATEPIQVD